MRLKRSQRVVSLVLVGLAATALARAETAKTWTFEKDGLVVSLVAKDAEFDDSRSYQVVVSDALRAITRLEVNRDGFVTDVWLTDMDGDGAFELVVATSQLNGSNNGGVDIHEWQDFRFASTRTPQLPNSEEAGYRGYDQFTLTEGRLGRSYPLFESGAAEPAPSGNMAHFEYRYAEGLWARVIH